MYVKLGPTVKYGFAICTVNCALKTIHYKQHNRRHQTPPPVPPPGKSLSRRSTCVDFAWLIMGKQDVIYKTVYITTPPPHDRAMATGSNRENLVSFGCMVPEICEQTDRHAPQNTPLRRRNSSMNYKTLRTRFMSFAGCMTLFRHPIICHLAVVEVTR